jgi:hypothetical protein
MEGDAVEVTAVRLVNGKPLPPLLSLWQLRNDNCGIQNCNICGCFAFRNFFVTPVLYSRLRR